MYGCGRVESSTTWQDLQFDPSEELVAVVNPSRGGLGMNFIFHRVADRLPRRKNRKYALTYSRKLKTGMYEKAGGNHLLLPANEVAER